MINIIGLIDRQMTTETCLRTSYAMLQRRLDNEKVQFDVRNNVFYVCTRFRRDFPYKVGDKREEGTEKTCQFVKNILKKFSTFAKCPPHDLFQEIS